MEYMSVGYFDTFAGDVYFHSEYLSCEDVIATENRRKNAEINAIIKSFGAKGIHITREQAIEHINKTWLNKLR